LALDPAVAGRRIMSLIEFLSLFTLTVPVLLPFTGMRLPVIVTLSSSFVAELLVPLVAQPEANEATMATASTNL